MIDTSSPISEHDKSLALQLQNPDAPPETMPLADEYQGELLAGLIYKPDLFAREQATLKHSWFNIKPHKQIFRIAQQYYQNYGTMPAKDVFEVEILKRIGAEHPSRNYYLAVLDTVIDQGEIVASKTQWLLDQIEMFREGMRLVDLMNMCADALTIRDSAKRKQALADCYKTFGEMMAPQNTQERRSYSIAELRKLPPQQWLIEGLIHKKSYVQIYGASEVGKSFLAVDMALSIATGRKFLGQFNTIESPVIYVAGEGGDGFNKRVDGWLLNNGLYDMPPDNFRCIKSQYRFVDMAEAVALLATIQQDVKKCFSGVQPAVIIIDTLANCIGGNEDGSEDMSAFNKSCLYLQSQTGATVIVVHHTGRDKTREKGNTRLRDANDMIFKVEGVPGATEMTVRCDKSKDVERFKAFNVRKIQIGTGDNSTLVLSYDGVSLSAKSTELVVALNADATSGRDELTEEMSGYNKNIANIEAWAKCLPATAEEAVVKRKLPTFTKCGEKVCRNTLPLAEMFGFVRRRGSGVAGDPFRYWRN